MDEPTFVVPPFVSNLMNIIEDSDLLTRIAVMSAQVAHLEREASGAAFQMAEAFRAFAESDAMKKVAELTVQLGNQQSFVSALDSAGWLPHTLLPYEAILAELNSSPPNVDGFVTNYTVNNWDWLEERLRNRAIKCGLDKDTLSAFDEALQAHRSGLYRASCRTIFPELERMFRQELMLTGRPDKVVKQFIEKALQRTLPETGSYGFMAVRLFEFLADGCYGQVLNPAQAPDLPNRHAVLHGFGSYATMKNSLNSLFVADFVFHLVAAIKAATTNTLGP